MSEEFEALGFSRDLPEINEEVWGAGMDVLRSFADALRTSDFKEVSSSYPAVIWAAMYDAAIKGRK